MKSPKPAKSGHMIHTVCKFIENFFSEKLSQNPIISPEVIQKDQTFSKRLVFKDIKKEIFLTKNF